MWRLTSRWFVETFQNYFKNFFNNSNSLSLVSTRSWTIGLYLLAVTHIWNELEYFSILFLNFRWSCYIEYSNRVAYRLSNVFRFRTRCLIWDGFHYHCDSRRAIRWSCSHRSNKSNLNYPIQVGNIKCRQWKMVNHFLKKGHTKTWKWKRNTFDHTEFLEDESCTLF